MKEISVTYKGITIGAKLGPEIDTRSVINDMLDLIDERTKESIQVACRLQGKDLVVAMKRAADETYG